MVIFLNMLSVLFGFAAAASWLYSAKVRVKPLEDERDEHGMKPASISVDGTDIFKSLRAQSKWSAIAALFAGGAAVMQGTVLLF